MAHRSHPVARLALVTSVLGLALVTAPLAAGAQEAAAAPPTLTQVLDGEVAGLRAEATTSSGMEMGVRVEVTNDTGRPVDVAIPFGTLVVTEDEGDQTLAVVPPTSPEVVEVAASGGTPTVEADAGTSTLKLDAYCTEMEDGYPLEDADVTPIDPAHPVLAETLRELAAADADSATVQDAIWWLTDQPEVPVPGHLRGLLAVDTEAFAAEPHLVTPDTGYIPVWMREQESSRDAGGMQNPTYDDEEAAGILDESFEGAAGVGSGSEDGGSAGGPLLWLALVGVVVAVSVVVAARAGRNAPTPVIARAAPGWYPDPWGGGGHRYWDGQSWTSRVI
jgi:hypothetical protein